MLWRWKGCPLSAILYFEPKEILVFRNSTLFQKLYLPIVLTISNEKIFITRIIYLHSKRSEQSLKQISTTKMRCRNISDPFPTSHLRLFFTSPNKCQNSKGSTSKNHNKYWFWVLSSTVLKQETKKYVDWFFQVVLCNFFCWIFLFFLFSFHKILMYVVDRAVLQQIHTSQVLYYVYKHPKGADQNNHDSNQDWFFL